MTTPHRHPRRHLRSRSTAAISTSADAAADGAGADAAARHPVERPAAPAAAASPRRSIASRWWRSPCRDAPELAGVGPRAAARRAVVHVATRSTRFHERGYAAVASCSSSSAPTRSPRSRPGATTRHPRRGALRGRLAARRSGRRAAASGCRRSRRAWCTPADRRRSRERPVDHSDRCADRRRVIHCDPRPARRRANRSPGSCRRASQQHIEQHGLYTSTTPGAARDRTRRDVRGRQVAWPRAEKRRKATRASDSRSTRAIARGRGQEGDRPRRARPAEGRRLHRLLRDLLGHQPAADSRDRRRRRWRRWRREGAKPAHVEGYDRSEWILLDYFDFIVHVFAPETRVFYGLERLWGNAERIEIADAVATRNARPARRGLQPIAATMAATAATLALRRARRRSRRRPRARLRRLRPAARTSDARSGLRRLLALDPAADAAALRSLRRSAADVARDQRAAGAVPALPARRRASSTARAPIGAYDGALRAIVHALKYDGRRSLARPLGALMRDARRRRARRRRRASCRCRSIRRGGAQRGFNQAADLARHLGLPVVPALRRVRATADADRPARGAASPQRPRRVRASTRAAARARRRDRRAGRRCEHDGRDAGCVRARAEGRRGSARRCGR